MIRPKFPTPEAPETEATDSLDQIHTPETDSTRLLGWRAGAAAPRRPKREPTAREREALRLEGLDLASRSGPFEWADVAWDLCDAGRPDAAAAFWKAVLELYDCDARVHLYHADSLSEAGRLEEALQAAVCGYEVEPELYEFQEAVLELLFALDRDESAFAWQDPVPTVVRLEPATRDRIRAHLLSEGECDLFDLRYTLFDDEFLCFDVEDLARDLEGDPGFEVCRFEGAAYVSLRAPSGRS